jgi:serine/threonine-protein kinase
MQPPASPDRSDRAPEPPKSLSLGDFRLIRKLGHGAMGRVFKARQISLERDVAVKVLYRHVAANRLFLQRFLREAKLMARLNHPNIVHCYGTGKSQGRYYLAMEYISGRTALEWLMRLGKYRVGDALHVALACAHALHYAHTHGLVHRDVKPDNVLIGKDGRVKLADLGLARTLQDDMALTQTGHGAGTPVYMAPEQARNAKHVDPRSDLYALGCMLYQLLTAHLPFPGSTVLDVVIAKMEGHYVPAREYNPEVPPQLEAIIARLLARFPQDRYQSAAALIEDLKALGLAHAQLSFLPASPTATHPTLSAHIETEILPMPEEGSGGRWHIIYRKANGHWVSREMTTNEVCSAIVQDEPFALTAQASGTGQGEHRSLETFSEFAKAYRERRRKARTEQQAAALAEEVEEVKAAERRQRRWGWLRRFVSLFRRPAAVRRQS